MATTNPKPDSMARQVAEQLRQDILAAGYNPGERFSTEAEVAERFEVSRTIAREAVSQLKALGVLESYRHSGLRIGRTDPIDLMSESLPFYIRSEEDFEHLAQMRFALEIGAVDLIVINATEEQIKHLDELAQQYEQAIAAGCANEEQDRIELQFHGLLLRMTHNPIIQGMHSVLENFFHDAPQSLPNWDKEPAELRMVAWEHHAIAKAVRQRDAEILRSALRTHLKTANR